MVALFCLFLALFASPFKSKSRLEAENVALRHQLIILPRKLRGRVRLTNSDRLFFIQLYRWFPSVLKAITIVAPSPRAMAPSRLPPVLALEIPLPWRPAANRRGPVRADPPEERRQPALGDGAPSCVTMCRTSPPWTCSLPQPWLRPALCPRHHSPGAPKPCLDQRHITSDRGMDRSIAHHLILFRCTG